MSNKRVNKAYVRYDGSGRVIPGSLILNRFKPAVGNWKETPAYLCCNPIPPVPFISTWRTTEPDELVSLFYVYDGTFTGTIDWGDGTITDNSYATSEHVYAIPGDYTITIDGTIIGFSSLMSGRADSYQKIISVSQFGNVKFGDSTGNGNGAFGQCYFVDFSTVVDVPDLTGVTNMSQFFAGVPSATVNRINEWDVSGVTIMAALFADSNINSDISSWDVSNVTNMSNMFLNNLFFNQDISAWNVGNVTDMGAMFSNTPFNQNISAWNVSSVTRMFGMFRSNSDFNQDISAWNVSSVTNMGNMFNSSVAFNQDLSGWCVSLIPSTPTNFALGASSWVLPKPVWGTCPV